MARFRGMPPRLGGALAVACGVVAGIAAVALAGRAAEDPNSSDSSTTKLEVSHLPPLLSMPGERVRLSFDAFCVTPESAAAAGDEGACDVTGSVFARPGASGSLTELPLTPSPAGTGHLTVDVPDGLAASPDGFSYYAILHAEPGDASATIPAGGADAPLSSITLGHPVEVDLGRHVFGKTRAAYARVASAVWGSGPLDAGLEPGRGVTPIGASAFDVDGAGNVYVLDEVHHRALRWTKGATRPGRIPVAVAGTLADMTVATDGSMYVLETVGQAGGMPKVRRFDSDGRELEAVDTAERDAAQIRLGPTGPVVLEHPSHQWMPVVVDGMPASPAEQRHGARSARPLPGGRDVVVLRRGSEIRVALLSPTGVRRTWRITSDTPIAEVQLAEPLGNRLVVVARAFVDDRDEFVVLLLGQHGLARTFSIEPADWAESAPLGRFKLAGSSLFRLGSTPAGVFVDRYDLEVR